MATLNKVFLMGNLTRDPELRYSQQGTAIATLGLAVSRVTGSGPERKEEVLFINAVTFKQLAERCSQHLHKGRPVMVEGRLQSRSWTDKDGNKRVTVEVVAENVQFLGAAGQGRAAPAEGAEHAPVATEDGGSRRAADEIVIPGEEEMF